MPHRQRCGHPKGPTPITGDVENIHTHTHTHIHKHTLVENCSSLLSCIQVYKWEPGGLLSTGYHPTQLLHQ